MPHTMIADAHRQSVDVIAWHPAGHLLSTASHDCILKFWCREPPGSKLELPPNEVSVCSSSVLLLYFSHVQMRRQCYSIY